MTCFNCSNSDGLGGCSLCFSCTYKMADTGNEVSSLQARISELEGEICKKADNK